MILILIFFFLIVFTLKIKTDLIYQICIENPMLIDIRVQNGFF